MTIIRVVVESTFAGQAGGFQNISIDDSRPVNDLIIEFCKAKGSDYNPKYSLLTKNNVVLLNQKPISEFFLSNGEVLKLITMRDDSKFLFRQWLTMAIIGMIVGIVGITVCVLLYVVFRNVPDSYAMVIDAGSTHTDMILYSWPGRKRNNTGEVKQVNMCSAAGGIAQVAPENISKYFDTCFEEAFSLINEAESKKTAEVLFGATAGMRLLNVTDSGRAAEIIARVRSYLEQSEWTFKSPNVGIIAGSTEGVSGWITSNFLEQTVLTKKSVNDTFGAMDLGGASTQISFEVSDSYKSRPNVYPITLFGNKFYVYSQSFLCHGVVQALRRYRAVLRMEQSISDPSATNISSPCEPQGWSFNATNSYFDSVCIGEGMTEEDKKKNWTIIGTGDYPECERVVSKILNYTECTNAKLGHCLDSSHIPPDVVHRRFYAFAAYGYITSDLKVPPMSPKNEVHRHIKVMCDFTKEQLSIVKSKSSNRKRKFEYLCFEGEYMFKLITQVYKFDSNSTWKQINFTNEVKQTTLGWSLGYMVNATEEIAAAPAVPTLKTLPFSLLTVLFVVFLLLSIGFVIHGLKVRKNSPGYQRRLMLYMDRELEKFIEPSSD